MRSSLQPMRRCSVLRLNLALGSRYADDLVFSGGDEPPPDLRARVHKIVTGAGWVLAEQKTHLARLPSRLKVHGLLVHGTRPRLTKGHRSRIRAFRHLHWTEKIADLVKVRGQLAYADVIGREKCRLPGASSGFAEGAWRARVPMARGRGWSDFGTSRPPVGAPASDRDPRTEDPRITAGNEKGPRPPSATLDLLGSQKRVRTSDLRINGTRSNLKNASKDADC
jgi:hypothetical protein